MNPETDCPACDGTGLASPYDREQTPGGNEDAKAGQKARPACYSVQIGGVLVDPYRIAMEYGLDGVIFQAVKKLLRGGRTDKPMRQDVEEAIDTLRRWIEIDDEMNGGEYLVTSSDDGEASPNHVRVTRLVLAQCVARLRSMPGYDNGLEERTLVKLTRGEPLLSRPITEIDPAEEIAATLRHILQGGE
jgi:hypothetical protein